MAINDATLRNYLSALAVALNHAQEKHPSDGRQDFHLDPSILWARMRDARIYDVPGEIYCSFYHAVDVYLDEKVTKKPWMPIDSDRVPEEEDSKRLMAYTKELGERQPYPEKLPFDNVYLAYGNGIGLTEHQGWAHLGIQTMKGIQAATLMGHLVCWDGQLFEFYSVLMQDDQRGFCIRCVHNTSGAWDTGISLTPFVVPMIVDFIRKHQTFVLPENRHGLGYKTKWKKHQKVFNIDRALPPPYYTIIVKDEIVAKTLDRLKEEKQKWNLSYQVDVAGHERMYIRRGPLPIDPEVADKLVNKREYKLFTIEDPPADLIAKMARRGQPMKRKNEWVAIHLTDIEPYRKGPEGAPFIPAVRRIPV